jgi:hypothetical protein
MYGLPHLEPKPEDVVWSQKSYDWRGNHRELQQVLWNWRMSDGTLSFAEIVEQRNVPATQSGDSPQENIAREIKKWLRGIKTGDLPGFKTYGEFGEKLKSIGYRALYELNKGDKLTGDQVSRLFTTQEPTNIRKQISANRAEG